MATGYTYRVVEGLTTTLEQFALHAATSFVYDCSVLPEKFENDDLEYHKERLDDAKAELKALRALKTVAAQQAYGQKIIADSIVRTEKSVERLKAQRDRILSMQKQVKAWKPLKTVQNVKKYMLEQLTETLRTDCDVDYYKREVIRLRAADPLDYYKNALKYAVQTIDHAKKQIDESKKTVKQSNQWLKDLRKSLKLP